MTLPLTGIVVVALEQAVSALFARFAVGPARTAHREEVTRICARAFAALTLKQAIAALDAAGVACGPVNYPEELIAHPQLAARQRWREVASPVGMVRGLLPPPISAGWEPRMDRIPGVGDDTRAILMALGRDDGEIGRLILDGVVSEPASAEG